MSENDSRLQNWLVEQFQQTTEYDLDHKRRKCSISDRNSSYHTIYFEVDKISRTIFNNSVIEEQISTSDYTPEEVYDLMRARFSEANKVRSLSIGEIQALLKQYPNVSMLVRKRMNETMDNNMIEKQKTIVKK